MLNAQPGYVIRTRPKLDNPEVVVWADDGTPLYVGESGLECPTPPYAVEWNASRPVTVIPAQSGWHVQETFEDETEGFLLPVVAWLITDERTATPLIADPTYGLTTTDNIDQQNEVTTKWVVVPPRQP